MIIKGSQRGNTRELARHLMNQEDNEHITLHRIEGFIGDNVHDAFAEVEAISRGTKCQQPLFSVSFNPPMGQSASIVDFEAAIEQVAQKNKLQDQPHVIIFHEKQGRRHAHAVWSRIDADSMTAINLPFYKNRLNEISKECYLKHGWDLPDGHKNKELRNPLNFTLAQWQQAKRLNDDPKQIKQALMECWAVSDNKQAFTKALEQQGYTLAKGDRRGFVAVDWRGEVYSLSKWMGVKTKALQERLGKPQDLLSVKQAKANHDEVLKTRLNDFMDHVKNKYQHRLKPLNTRKADMTKRHAQERATLAAQQWELEKQEIQHRQARFHKGMRGLWDRLTGKHRQIQAQNEMEALTALQRRQAQKDKLIFRQLEQRRFLQELIDKLNTKQCCDAEQFKQAIFQKLPEHKIKALELDIEQPTIKPEHNTPRLEM